MQNINKGVVLRDPGCFCPLHLNPELEIVFVKNGTLQVGYDDRLLQLHGGQFSFILPYHMHSFEALTPCDATVYIFSQLISEPYIKHSCIPDVGGIYSVASATASYIAFLDDNRTTINGYSYATGLLTAFVNSPSVSEEYKSENAKEHGDTENQSIYTFPYLEESEAKLVLYIFDHMAEELTLEKLAKVTGWNSKKLSGTFKRKYDIKILDLIANIRVERASVLLCSKEKSISEIASRCGFGSLRSFNRCFKAIMGVTPSQYRSNNSK